MKSATTTHMEYVDMRGRQARKGRQRYVNLEDLRVFLLLVRAENDPTKALDLAIENIEKLRTL